MSEAPNELYVTTTDSGDALVIEALYGNRITVRNPETSALEVHCLEQTIFQYCFNGSAWIEGVPNQSLAEGNAYYVGIMLKDGVLTPLFWQRGFVDKQNRYAFRPEGISTYIDPTGNEATLICMCFVQGSSVLSYLYGAGSRMCTMQTPWSGASAQALSANTGQWGVTIVNTDWSEVQPNWVINSCCWAWRGVKTRWNGRVANGAGTSFGTLFFRPVAQCYTSGQVVYGDTVIHQIQGAGVNNFFCAEGINLALDDGVYRFSAHVFSAGGSPMTLSLSQTLDGWL